MKTKTFKQIGLLIQLFTFSIITMASENSNNNTVKSDDVIVHANLPVVTQAISPYLSASMSRIAFSGNSGDTVLTEDTEDENLYGYKAMEYSDEKYNYDLPYRLYIPENYQEGEKYPLVIFLHGSGKRGSDNVSQIKDMSGPLAFVNQEVQQKHPSFVFAPQCRKNERWRGESYSGERRPTSFEDVKPSSAYLMLMDLLTVIQDEYGHGRKPIRKTLIITEKLI